jgi:hypothetical protein
MTDRFRTIPIPTSLAETARRERRSPQYGHPAHTETASGHGPCRLCLDTFRVGAEDRLLFTYDPFAGLDPIPAPGPVFVHAAGCSPFAAPSGFPESLRALPFILDGYAPGPWLVAREHAAAGEVEAAAARIFAHVAVAYIHVRNADAGCYVARLERVT